MSIYQRFAVPRLINWAMSNKDATRCRSEIVPRARGEVLEVGVGSGLNLSFYSNQVQKVRGLDPSEELLKMARKRASSASVPVELLNGSAEAIPVESQTIDTVVMTWTLCSIPDPGRALAEMLRVLKPGGELLFVEHGLSSDLKIGAWQNRINRTWRAFAGGCNLNREIDLLITSTGFRILQLDKSYLPGPRVLTFTYRGNARRVE
jgi:ubiquinone/menaquinone biosynthesis C-methylase UbiE